MSPLALGDDCRKRKNMGKKVNIFINYKFLMKKITRALLK